jgi:hypothetical protein
VRNSREDIFKPRLRFASIEEGNAWLMEENLRQAATQAHPDLAGMTVAEAFEIERAALRPPGAGLRWLLRERSCRQFHLPRQLRVQPLLGDA